MSLVEYKYSIEPKQGFYRHVNQTLLRHKASKAGIQTFKIQMNGTPRLRWLETVLENRVSKLEIRTVFFPTCPGTIFEAGFLSKRRRI